MKFSQTIPSAETQPFHRRLQPVATSFRTLYHNKLFREVNVKRTGKNTGDMHRPKIWLGIGHRWANLPRMIHPTAVIDPRAKLDSTVEVGPYAVIDAGVELGEGCTVGPHVYMTGQTRAGARNRFHAGCVIGEAPQDLKYAGAPTRLRIGDGNVFREHVTIHRSTTADGETVIGSDCFLMANSHVGHNSAVKDRVIIANGGTLGGHVSVDDRAFISGNCLVHQFVRVGMLAIMQGGSAISKDLPPYTVARGDNGICGLNTVGLRRAGLTAAERLELKQLYRFLFRSGRNLRAAVAEATRQFTSPHARVMLEFLAGSRRGVCFDTSLRSTEPETEE
jgi:UDP-N-acetylglucosamine acyltransferase